MDLQALVLAAGKSTRFHTQQTKLSFPLCGKSMILYPLGLLQQLDIPTTVVIGHQKEAVQQIIQSAGLQAAFCEQKEQKGTGHAVITALPLLSAAHLLVMNGDVPLINQRMIKELIIKHLQSNAAVTFVAAHNADPSLTGYGRVVKTEQSIKIVEPKEFEGDAQTDCCVNAGIYLIRRTSLLQHLPTLIAQAHKRNGEIYLTDLIAAASAVGETVEMSMASFDLIRGVNTMKELWAAEQIKRAELITHWMERGVRFTAAQTVQIDVDVEIGTGTTVGMGAVLLGTTKIGQNCTIEPYAVISNSTLSDGAIVRPHCVISDSHLQQGSIVGPFAHIRGASVIAYQAVIGNFVEVNASTIGAQSKAKHLSYLGNAQVGEQVNIGAGTITCNYDGQYKHTTAIEDGAFIGSNTSIIAPVTIGKHAITAAGSVITEDVPSDALAIARSRQINKPDYAEYLREKRSTKSAKPLENSTITGPSIS